MMCNKQVADTVLEDDENVQFLNLSKHMLMCHMPRESKVTVCKLKQVILDSACLCHNEIQTRQNWKWLDNQT